MLLRPSSSPTRMLPGLTSRWTSPAACAASSPHAACATSRSARSGSRGPSRWRISRRSEPVDILHCQKQKSVRFARGNSSHHVRVVKRRGQSRLSQEALPEPLICGQLGRHDLECDLFARARILGEVDAPHCPPADHRLHSEAGNEGVAGNTRRHELPRDEGRRGECLCRLAQPTPRRSRLRENPAMPGRQRLFTNSTRRTVAVR